MDYKVKTINISVLCCGALIDGERSILARLEIVRTSSPQWGGGEKGLYFNPTQINNTN